MARTLIHHARIVDGTGAPSYDGWILIEDERIAAVERGNGAGLPPADTVVDAGGKVAAPGFIDMHSHGDWLLPVENQAEYMRSMLEQGVTTLVAGNCGVSPAPVRRERLPILERFAAMFLDAPLQWAWQDMDGYLGAVERRGPAVNVAELVGHSTVRYATSDIPRGQLPKEDLDRALDATREALDQGAVGLSFGLGYEPAMYSPLEELEAFCKVAAERHKPVTVHLKALSRLSPTYPLTYLKPHNLRALDEMLEIARRTGCRLQLSHFIFVGRSSWSTAAEALRRVEQARRDGVDVMIDAFPYTAGNTTLHAPLPYWFLARLPGGWDERATLLRLRAELELGFRLVGFLYDDFQVMDAGVPGWEDINGLNISGIARKWKVSSFEAFRRIARASHGSTLMLFHAYSGADGDERALEAVLRDSHCLFETDAIVKKTGWPNPAGVGTFPKVLGDMVRRRKLFSLEEAVRRMTGASTERFALADRGVLAPGKAADVVLFDPATVDDSPAAPGVPAARPKGIERVFVNGTQVVEAGVHDGSSAGRVLRA